MEVGLISSLFSRKGSSSMVKGVRVHFKPRKLLRKLMVSEPYQQKLEINAYSPATYFTERIACVFDEMRSIYGNIPLWINYAMVPSTVSWNLGSVKAIHNILVYGEKKFVKDFLSRFEKIIESDKSNTSGINILSHNTSNDVQGYSNLNSGQPLPVAIQGTSSSMTFRSSLLSASSLIAGLAGIALALSFLSSKRSSNSKQRVSRQDALKAAIDSVSEILHGPPILENEEFVGNCWRFKLSNYVVTVDSKGVVTQIRRVQEND